MLQLDLKGFGNILRNLNSKTYFLDFFRFSYLVNLSLYSDSDKSCQPMQKPVGDLPHPHSCLLLILFSNINYIEINNLKKEDLIFYEKIYETLL